MLKRVLCTIIMLCGFVSICLAGRIDVVYQRLSQVTGVYVPLQISNDSSLGAWTNGRKIVVTAGLARSVTSNEMAFVLAHEISHILYGLDELGADRGAIDIANSAGYNACTGGTKFFRRLLALYGDQSDNAHPLTSLRLRLHRAHAC